MLHEILIAGMKHYIAAQHTKYQRGKRTTCNIFIIAKQNA